ncbi:heavy metal translocating P-type ATPase [Sinanaerobacter sp. ZZT-01]|uniref:heavy metal translocating P-type ATPase n=1 Tax=Sinanaerobacter sp. ZZT-01 TaxID=3111540 RepID=UPI002D76C3B6|nr:heavy metal translocating P-type ATPase [Sinanaerobacter sp. ZZT-01]WRR94580.1 heavy metal translocating P-type ATPase [Sinanaerobacter sp. ZZT-01]
MKQKFDITGMTCSACSSRVEKSINKLDGVAAANVNLLTNSMQVEYNENQLNEESIVNAVKHAGYGASVHETTNQKSSKGTSRTSSAPNMMEEQLHSMKERVWVSFIFLIPLFYISMGHMMGAPLPAFLTGIENGVSYALTQFLLCLPIVYINRKYYQVGFKTLLHGAPNMDSLIAIGSSAALIYGLFAIYRIGYGLGIQNLELAHQYHMDLYFESAATILALITLGKYLETRSKGKTSEAITKLMDLAPKTAIVERDGKEIEIAIEEIVAEDIFLVKPGASVPADGIILEGSSSLDESALTGESIPVEKKAGDSITAATINKAGFLKCRATKVGNDTTLAQIIALVEEASASKAPIANMADKITGIFVPVVIAIAVASTIIWLLLGATFEFALSIGIAVLVISCPCALGLATPVAIMVGTGKGAQNGILIKSGEALETAHNIKTVVLDKTGTITEGKPQVTDILTVSQEKEFTEQNLLQLAATLEKQSEHPLAEAILNAAKQKQIMPSAVSNFTAIFGRGVKGSINGSLYLAGNAALLKENNISLASYEAKIDQLAQEGKTPLLFASEKELLGIIAVADVVKPTSKRAISALKDLGIHVIMLTGDNKKTASAIQNQLEISTVIAEVLPQDKEKEIVALQKKGHKVAMVGDGINDAPALARADVGIAIGAGTDVAIESADIVLMKNDLLDAVTAIKLSKAVIRNIKQNLFWAFFYNSVGIPLAAGLLYGLYELKLNPMFAAFAMSLSSVCVVSNALRLKLFKADHTGISTALPQSAASPIIEPIISNEQKGEEKKMKTLKMNIEGMSCSHCSGRVTDVLNAIDGVEAKVNLAQQSATIALSKEVDNSTLKKAVEDAGYHVTSIEEE